MKNRLKFLFLIFPLFINPSILLCQIEPEFSTLVTLKFTDDQNNPVADVSTSILFNHLVDEKTITHKGLTDPTGKFTANSKIIASLTVIGSKDAHYPICLDPALTRMEVDQRKVKALDLDLVIRERLNPRPLLARKISRAIPLGERPVGFDLKLGDWTEPQGVGKVADFMISTNKSFLNYYENRAGDAIIESISRRHAENPLAKKEYFQRINEFYESQETYTYEDAAKHSAGVWSGELIVNFNNPHEGASLVDKDYHTYSYLRMPHSAYTFGYKPKILRTEVTLSPSQCNPNIGYFLRTRVQTDETGKIVSANYSKIIEDITFDPRGRITFSYIFNPTPNDRNLEFDPEKNLFGKLPDAEQVLSP